MIKGLVEYCTDNMATIRIRVTLHYINRVYYRLDPGAGNPAGNPSNGRGNVTSCSIRSLAYI